MVVEEATKDALSEIQKNIDPKYFINGFIDSIAKYQSSDKSQSESAFILSEMKKLPLEYKKDLEDYVTSINQ